MSEKKESKPPKKKWLYAILILAFLFVLMPYLFWQATWFGRPLNDAQMEKAFTDKEHPRDAQHALSQIADRMMSADANARASARAWYPHVLAAAANPHDEIRLTAAWVMGQDNSVAEFHPALTKLLGDTNPMVRRNAALSLVRFGDAAGHDVIVGMLKPYAMPAPEAGKLIERLVPGDVVNPGTKVGRLEVAGKDASDLRTEVPGTLAQWTVADGAQVTSGQTILVLDPSAEMAWEALRGLYLVGRSEDIPAITPFVRGMDGMSPNVAQQATATLEAIKQRGAASSGKL
jgi:hypothetical protein